MVALRPGEKLTLPGGLLEDGDLQREVRLRPLTGHLEMECYEIASRRSPLPRAVSETLSVWVESIGERPFDAQQAASLCVAWLR